MLAGKVVGSIVSTRKHDKLVGNKFMIVEVVEHMKEIGRASCRERVLRLV